MKTSVVKFFAGSGIRLAVLSVLSLGMVGVCMAQASVAPARPAAQATVATQAQPVAQPAQTAARQPAPKGTREGIKIHGHWTIEVRSPDGKLVTHREFENSLNTASGGTNGQTLLAALLGRTATESSWSVTLQAPPGSQDYIVISEPNSVASAYCNPAPTNGAIQSCSSSLTISGPQCSATTSPCPILTGNTLTLNGSGTVPQGFAPTIGNVNTEDVLCAVSSESSQTCFSDTTNPNVLSLVFTSRNLDGQNGDPAPVSVTAGQMVAVTVVISFM